MGAIGYFEAYYKLTKGRVWQNDDGEDLHANSCEHLRRVYTTIAEQVNYFRYPSEGFFQLIPHL